MRQMKCAVCLPTLLSFLFPVQSTHLAAVYKNDILILRDADLILPNSPLSWESLSLDLPLILYYPVGLTQDSLNNRLFVAEVNPRAKRKILSLTLNEQLEVVDMATVVKSGLMSVIEGMSYSPKSGHLYWTDATDKHIYKAMVLHELGDTDTVSTPEKIDYLGSITKPRGLAVDPCNELLYWSEKGGERMPSRVEMWNPDDNNRQVVQEDEGKNLFYQGLSFDATTRSLLWAVTKSDELNSTCHIGKTSVDEMHHEDLVNLENCYPFSLTSDEKYIYWSDWGRQGIMRASLTDPSDVVKLVHTPHTISNQGKHIGVYGLTKLITENPAGENSCKDKHGKTQNNEDKVVRNPAENPHQEAEEEEKGTGDIMEVSDVSFSDPESTNERQEGQDQEAEGPKESPGADKINNHEKEVELVENAGTSRHSEGRDMENPAVDQDQEAEEKKKGTGDMKEGSHVSVTEPESIKERQDGQNTEAEGPKESSGTDKSNNGENDAGSSGHSEEREMENNIVHEDRIVMSVKYMMKPQADSPSRKPVEEAKFKSVDSVTGVYNDKTQTDQFGSLATQDLPSTESFPGCHKGQLIIALLVLAAFCALFLGSTIVLAIMYRRRTVSCKGTSEVTLETPQAVPVQPPRQVKRFGPKKSVASGKKSGLSAYATCSGSANDGVTINIEDCCQMTLCETPCYTTIKKQGKSYKGIGKNTRDDKKGLLDDSEEI